VDPRDLAFAGAAKQVRMLADGSITAPALLGVYLERIARLRTIAPDEAWEAAVELDKL